MDTITKNLRAWALHFAERGWHVFPITPGAKKPPGDRPVGDPGQHRPRPNPPLVAPHPAHASASPPARPGWSWSTSTPANTGNPRPDRWATLGIGSGVGVLRMLARQHHTTVTPTYAVTTPSGGWHLYYTAPAGVALRNTHDVIGFKIDTRAHGGYVVAPGSPVPPSGYELIDDRDPVELPGWLHQALTPKPPTALSAPASDGRCQPRRLHVGSSAG